MSTYSVPIGAYFSWLFTLSITGDEGLRAAPGHQWEGRPFEEMLRRQLDLRRWGETTHFFTNPTRGIWKYMECKGIFSQHVVLYGVVQKWGQGFQVWSSGILYFTILLSLYTCYTSIYCISGINRPNLESHRIPMPILVVRFVGMGSKFEETRWTPSRTALYW